MHVKHGIAGGRVLALSQRCLSGNPHPAWLLPTPCWSCPSPTKSPTDAAPLPPPPLPLNSGPPHFSSGPLQETCICNFYLSSYIILTNSNQPAFTEETQCTRPHRDETGKVPACKELAARGADGRDHRQWRSMQKAQGWKDHQSSPKAAGDAQGSLSGEGGIHLKDKGTIK